MASFRLPQERAALIGIAGLATFLTVIFLFQSSTTVQFDLKDQYVGALAFGSFASSIR